MLTIPYPHTHTVIVDGISYENYTISRDGKVWSMKRNIYLSLKGSYYYQVGLSNGNVKKMCYVHRIVATVFIPNPKNHPIVNHKDGNIHNNHEENLEWVSAKENSQHAHNTGLQGVYKRAVVQYDLAGNYIAEYDSIVEASQKTGICKKTICNICRGVKRKTCNGYRWAYKGEKLDIKPYAHCRPVNQLGIKTKSIINTFQSAKEAASHINVANSWMANCCRNNRICQGYRWEYAETITEIDVSVSPHIQEPDMYAPLEIKGTIIDGYFVSKKGGKIWSEKRKRYLSQNICHGYYSQCISHDKKLYTIRTHRCVALLFVPNPHGYDVVNHIDGNKLNNDADNLEWCTAQQNCQHAYDMGLSDAKNKRAVVKFSLSGKKLGEYDSLTNAGKDVGIHHQTIREVCNKTMLKAGGFKWTFKGEEDTLSFINKAVILVDQIDPDTMELIETHEGISAASRSINYPRNRINRAYKNGKVCAGYLWRPHD